MHLFIVYAHPSEQSLTREVRDVFIRGLQTAHHTFEMSGLYAIR
ncbi:MAG: NAD(P)H-dependent oxidoreductase [Chitinispirillaceae bacterium]|nr:NAD(P)H-dependent oxidoreductase [Chitinispirillaceae bacterium]